MKQKLLIVATLDKNPQIPSVKTNISCDLTIQELLEQIIQTYRIEVDEKIFSDQNKQLFELSFKEETLDNRDFIKDCLGEQGSYNIRICILNNSRNPKTQERINQLDLAISEIKNYASKKYFDQTMRKNLNVYFQLTNEVQKVIKITFECFGGEVTFKDLKLKLLDTYQKQNPFYEYFQKPNIFSLKILDQVYGDDCAEQIVKDKYPNQDSLDVLLEFQFPIWNGQQNILVGCADACKAMIQTGIKFCHILYQAEYSLKNVNETDRQVIVENILEQSIVEYHEQVQIKYTDEIRNYLQEVKDYNKLVSEERFFATTISFGYAACRKAKILNNAIKLQQRSPKGFVFNFLNLSSSKVVQGMSYGLGVVNFLFDVGCLFNKKLSKKEFTIRFLVCGLQTVTQNLVYGLGAGAGSAIAAYLGSTNIASLGASFLIGKFPCLAFLSTGFLPYLIGIISGFKACVWLSQKAEQLIDWLFPQKESTNNQDCLNEISQDKFYENSLKYIGCNNLTSDKDIKKIRLQKLKELHPDQAKEKYDKEKFLQTLVAFQAIKEYRRNLALKQK